MVTYDNTILSTLLLRWYSTSARTLPWRSFPTPYRVWVSEIMLQQTRVETVLPYFERFISALPNARALAGVDDAALMKLWEGLGYYSRARNMKRAAELIVARHGGELPGTYGQLLELPGLGEYAAGAVASIAFNLPVPAVDGNVLRVLARVFSCGADITKPDVRQRFRRLVSFLQPKDRPGDFNQALMDLGATICLPNGAPHCPDCPWQNRCAAHKHGRETDLPMKTAKKPRVNQRRTVFIVINSGCVLLLQRPGKGLLAGLWELPGAEGWLDSGGAAEYLRRMGAAVHSLNPLEDAKHVFSHVEWHMRGWLAEVDSFSPQGEFLWADGAALKETVALPSAFKAYRRFLP